MPDSHPPAPGTPPPTDAAFSPTELAKALKAFKKRLKLTQLDFDSRIGASPLSGHASGIVAITPPNQYPRAVRDALVEQGKLKKGSQGQYELA